MRRITNQKGCFTCARLFHEILEPWFSVENSSKVLLPHFICSQQPIKEPHHFSEVRSCELVMCVVKCRCVDEEKGEDAFEWFDDDTAVKIQVQSAPKSEVRQVGRPMDFELRQAEQNDGTKRVERFEWVQREAGEDGGVVERVVRRVDCVQVTAVKRVMFPKRPSISAESDDEHLEKE